MYRRILGPVYDNEKENWRILTEIKTKEHNNRQNINICNRNLDTSKEREKTIKHF